MQYGQLCNMAAVQCGQRAMWPPVALEQLGVHAGARGLVLDEAGHVVLAQHGRIRRVVVLSSYGPMQS